MYMQRTSTQASLYTHAALGKIGKVDAYTRVYMCGHASIINTLLAMTSRYYTCICSLYTEYCKINDSAFNLLKALSIILQYSALKHKIKHIHKQYYFYVTIQTQYMCDLVRSYHYYTNFNQVLIHDTGHVLCTYSPCVQDGPKLTPYPRS